MAAFIVLVIFTYLGLLAFSSALKAGAETLERAADVAEAETNDEVIDTAA